MTESTNVGFESVLLETAEKNDTIEHGKNQLSTSTISILEQSKEHDIEGAEEDGNVSNNLDDDDHNDVRISISTTQKIQSNKKDEDNANDEKVKNEEQQGQEQEQQVDTTSIPSAGVAAAETAVAVAEGEEDAEQTAGYEDNDKRGGKFFGCLCDYRRAVIIVNCFYLLMFLYNTLSNTALWNAVGDTFPTDADINDAIQEEIQSQSNKNDGTDHEVTFKTIHDDAFDMVIEYSDTRTQINGIAAVTTYLALLAAIDFGFWPVVINMFVLTADYIIFCFLSNQIYDDLQAYYHSLTEDGTVTGQDDTNENATIKNDEDLTPPDPTRGYIVGGIFLIFWLYPHMFYTREVLAGIIIKN